MKLRLTIILIASIALNTFVMASANARAIASSPARAMSQGAYTPAKGSAERQAIMDSLRAEMRRNDDRELIFVVQYIKAHKGWAWVTVNPQSPNGDQRYESESALLRKRGRTWRVLERSAGGGAGYYRKLKSKYKSVPMDIFPST